MVLFFEPIFAFFVILQTTFAELNITYPSPQYYQSLHTESYTNETFNDTRENAWSEFSVSHSKLTKLNLNQILLMVPSIEDSLPVHSTNEECAKHCKFVLRSANQLEVWALKMIDSSGKIPPSLLNGNINQLGDFDQCMTVHGTFKNISQFQPADEEIYGKYCLASIDITLPPAFETINNLIHSHYVIRSKLTDPGHRIPKFASMYWALCIPHSCSNDDVKEWLVQQLQKLKIPGLRKDISVDESMCQTRDQSNRVGIAAVFTVTIFCVMIIVSLIATFTNEQKVNEMIIQCRDFNSKLWYILLESFSLKKNYKALTNLNGPSDDVACLHGIRAINAIALLLSHKCMQLLYYSYVNRTQMTEMISYPFSMLARSAILYTDSFILISGCLAAQCFLKNFDRKNSSVLKNYINRFFRLTPNLLAIILFCTFILPLLNAGPLWNEVVSKHSELCRKYWWRNLLYVHNYYGFEEMVRLKTEINKMKKKASVRKKDDIIIYRYMPLIMY